MKTPSIKKWLLSLSGISDGIIRHEKKTLFLLSAIAFLGSLLLTIFISYPRGSGVDGATYALSGWNLFHGQGFTYSDVPNTFTWPLFSVLIGLASFIIDDLQIASHAILILSFSLSVIPFYYLAKNLFNPPTALMAVTLYALNGFLLRLSSRLLPETVLILLLVTAYYFVSRILKAFEESSKAAWQDFLAAGLFLGLAYLTKPEAFQFAVIIIIFLTVLMIKKHIFRAHAASLLMLIVIFILVITPQIRFVHDSTGKWVLTTYNRFFFRPLVEPFLGLNAGAPSEPPHAEYNYNAYIVRSPYTEEAFRQDLERFPKSLWEYGRRFFTIIGILHLSLFIASLFLFRKRFVTGRVFLYLLLIPLITLALWYRTIDRHFMMHIPVWLLISSAVIHDIRLRTENRPRFRLVWAALFIFVLLASYKPIANNTLTNRVLPNHRKMGEWMNRNLPDARGRLIADRKPFITFLAHGRYFRYNKPKDTATFVKHLQQHGVDYLIVEEFMVKTYNRNVGELLQPMDRPGLNFIHEEYDPVYGSAILYRVLPDE